VTSLTNFGCFMDLGGGIDGMIHISDITREKRLNHPREALSAGQTVRAVVLEVDRERRRIKLGIKQLEPTTADEYIAEHQVGQSVTGPDCGGFQGARQDRAGRWRFRRMPVREEIGNGTETPEPAVAKADLVR
jgi:transcriptional accessory protein Tex/SPT6